MKKSPQMRGLFMFCPDISDFLRKMRFVDDFFLYIRIFGDRILLL